MYLPQQWPPWSLWSSSFSDLEKLHSAASSDKLCGDCVPDLPNSLLATKNAYRCRVLSRPFVLGASNMDPLWKAVAETSVSEPQGKRQVQNPARPK